MASRGTANLIAVVVFFAVLLVGAAVIGANHRVEHPTTTTTVTKSAVAASNTSQRSTQLVAGARGRPQARTTTTTISKTPASPESTETTKVSGGRSLIERLLGDSGVVFLQIAVVLLAAFIAAAAIQRVLVGQFGGLKVGSLEVSEIANVSDESVAKLQAALAAAQQESSKKLGAVKADVKTIRTRLARTTKESSALDSELSSQLSLIASRLANVESKLKDG